MTVKKDDAAMILDDNHDALDIAINDCNAGNVGESIVELLKEHGFAIIGLIQAKQLAEMAATVDGGCSVCVREVVQELNEIIPFFSWNMDERARVTVTLASEKLPNKLVYNDR